MRIHVVQKGDTLEKIAKKYEVEQDSVKKMNAQLTSPDSLKPGMKVKVPTGGVPVRKAKPSWETSRTRGESTKKAPKKAAPKKEEPKKSPINENEEKEKTRSTKVAVSHADESGKMEWSGGMPESNQGYPPTGDWPMNYGHHMYPEMPGMPEYPNPMQYGPGPGGMYPEAVSPASYGPNPNTMYPQQMSPAYYGSAYEPTPNAYGPNMYPEAMPYHPWPNANPMYPENVSPAQYQPNMMPNAVHPLNTIPAGSPCNCGSPIYGYPQGPTSYMPPQPPMVSPQMGMNDQPEFWEPNNAGFYGMMPAGTRTDSNDENS